MDGHLIVRLNIQILQGIVAGDFRQRGRFYISFSTVHL